MDRTQLDRLYGLLQEQSKKQIPIQTAWGIVKEVDWDEKTATVVGVVDGLEYYDVALGIGHKWIKPKLNTKCIIGAIGNKDVDAFMLDCQDVEEMVLKTSNQLMIKLSNDEIIIEAVDKPISINSANSSVAISQDGIDINSEETISINGSFEALYNKVPGMPITDVSQIGVSSKVKLG